MQGFRLMRMDAQALTDIVSPDEVPSPVFSFLSDDLFRAIWCDIASPDAFTSKNAPSAPMFGYFGIKGLKGVYSGGFMAGFIDLAFAASGQEIPALAQLVSRALSGYASFSAALFAGIRIDKNGDYFCDRNALLGSLYALPAGGFPPFVLNPELKYRKPRDLLHFAACLGSRERAMEVLGVRPTLFRRQTGLLDADAFDACTGG